MKYQPPASKHLVFPLIMGLRKDMDTLKATEKPEPKTYRRIRDIASSRAAVRWAKAGTVALIVSSTTGCMQLLGAQELDAWGLKVKGTTGFEVKAGVQQYDQVHDQRGIGNGQKTFVGGMADSKTGVKY